MKTKSKIHMVGWIEKQATREYQITGFSVRVLRDWKDIRLIIRRQSLEMLAFAFCNIDRELLQSYFMVKTLRPILYQYF